MYNYDCIYNLIHYKPSRDEPLITSITEFCIDTNTPALKGSQLLTLRKENKDLILTCMAGVTSSNGEPLVYISDSRKKEIISFNKTAASFTLSALPLDKSSSTAHFIDLAIIYKTFGNKSFAALFALEPNSLSLVIQDQTANTKLWEGKVELPKDLLEVEALAVEGTSLCLLGKDGKGDAKVIGWDFERLFLENQKTTDLTLRMALGTLSKEDITEFVKKVSKEFFSFTIPLASGEKATSLALIKKVLFVTTSSKDKEAKLHLTPLPNKKKATTHTILLPYSQGKKAIKIVGNNAFSFIALQDPATTQGEILICKNEDLKEESPPIKRISLSEYPYSLSLTKNALYIAIVAEGKNEKTFGLKMAHLIEVAKEPIPALIPISSNIPVSHITPFALGLPIKL
ncbi:MAG: hypothetical protein JSR76_03390 [Verrucomicrobia bacterium]|nr:hypothetical protein [Verrucomicrobiota bacterium]